MKTAESCSSYGPPPGVDFALPAVLRTGCGLAADRPCLAPAFWRERGSASFLSFEGQSWEPASVRRSFTSQRRALTAIGAAA
jgi:hypothetical protein